MPDDFVINVRQVTQYPLTYGALATDVLLLQRYGLGGPYQSIYASELVKTALNSGGPFGVAATPAPDADAGEIWCRSINFTTGNVNWNKYYAVDGRDYYIAAGHAGTMSFSHEVGVWYWEYALPGAAGAQMAFGPAMNLTGAGHLTLNDQIEVGREAVQGNELPTLDQTQALTSAMMAAHSDAVMRYVSAWVGDARADLKAWLDQATADFTAPLESLQRSVARLECLPAVARFNGRSGDVWLWAIDIAQAGGALIDSPGFIGCPTAPTPPWSDSSARLATTEYVTRAIHNAVWTGPPGPPGPPGKRGPRGEGLRITGAVDTEGDLPLVGCPGDLVLALDTGHAFSWDQAGNDWVDIGQIGGPPGPQGPAGPAGPEGPQGPIGTGLEVKGSVDDAAELPTTGNAIGDLWVISGSGEGYLWVGDPPAWLPLGPVRGPAGPQGAQGSPGPAGPQGDMGVQGPMGIPGPQGDGLRIAGVVPSQGNLPQIGNPGDIILVEQTGDAWLWDATESQWVNIGPIVGPEGPQGPPGENGTGVISGDTPPDNPAHGDLWFDTGGDTLKFWDGSDWVAAGGDFLPLAGGTLTGPLKVTGITWDQSYTGAIDIDTGVAPQLSVGSNTNPALSTEVVLRNAAVISFGGAWQISTPAYGGSGLPFTISGFETGASVLFNNPVTLGAGDPTQPLQAATKQYVDNAVGAGGDFLPLAGGTLTGRLNITAGGMSAVAQAGSSITLQALGTTGNQIQLLTNLNAPVLIRYRLQVSALTADTYAGPNISILSPLMLAADPTVPLQAATKQYVDNAIATTAVASFNSRTGAVTLQGADLTGAGGALLASPTFTGTPAAPTAAQTVNNTQIATTAYVRTAISAVYASPTFTGVPAGPTASPGTNTTQLATTAFVAAAIAATGNYLPLTGGTLTGDLTINKAGGGALRMLQEGWIELDSPTAASAWLYNSGIWVGAATGTQDKWWIGWEDDFSIIRFDGQPAQGTPLKIYRTGAMRGQVWLERGIVCGSMSWSGSYSDWNYQGIAWYGANADVANRVNLRWTLGHTAEADDANQWMLNSYTNTGVANYPIWCSRATGGVTLGALIAGNARSGTQVTIGTTNTTNAIATVTSSTSSYPMSFFYNTTNVGSITTSTTATSYNTTSDARLKCDERPLTGGRSLLDRLPVYDFGWIGSDERALGMLAQEVDGIVPGAVSRGNGDPGERDFQPWGVDYSKFVPLLISALQEAFREIDMLKRRRH